MKTGSLCKIFLIIVIINFIVVALVNDISRGNNEEERQV